MLYVPYQSLWYTVFVNWPPFIHIQRFEAPYVDYVPSSKQPTTTKGAPVFTLMEEIYVGRSVVEEAFVICSKLQFRFSCKEAVFFPTVPLTPAVSCTYKCSQIIRNIW